MHPSLILSQQYSSTWSSYLVLTDLVPYRRVSTDAGWGSVDILIDIAAECQSHIDCQLSDGWVLVTYQSGVSGILVKYQSSVNLLSTESHDSISSVSAMYQWTIRWVSVCIRGILVKHCECETNLVPWCKHLDTLISSLLWCKLHFARLECSKHFLRCTPPAETQIPPISAVFF